MLNSYKYDWKDQQTDNILETIAVDALGDIKITIKH